MSTNTRRVVKADIEQTADSFVRDHLQRNPGLELVPVQLVGEDRKSHSPNREDVHAYLSTLESQEDAVLRYDANETDTDVDLNAKPLESTIAIDAKPVILARRLGHKQIYFSGVHERTKRLLWTYDPRLAHRFHDDADVIRTVFQFQEPGDLVMKDVFAGLGLTLMAPPPTPSF